MMRRFSLAAAAGILILAAGTALAEPDPPPPPPPSGPVALPYPDPEPLPPECKNRFCVPPPGGAQGGAIPHKHIGNVKYSAMESAAVELTESDGGPARSVQAVGLSLSKLDGAGPVYSADPMEGGQVTSSDSNVAERKLAPGKPTYGNLVEDAPVMTPDAGTQAVAKGTATFKTLAGACATGKHLVKVKITTRTSSVTLHDATVVSVVPAEPVDGQAMEEVTLNYESAGD